MRGGAPNSGSEMAKSEVRWIVTANFTADGAVAYRRADGTWSRKLAEAEALAAEDEATPIVARVAKLEQREISDPYGIDVGSGPEGLFPLTARERIRAHGPTVPIRRAD
jgi:hypothetical protein